MYWQVNEREVKEFSKPPLPEQGVIMNSAIDIPKRKDKEDLNESSEVQLDSFALAFCALKSFLNVNFQASLFIMLNCQLCKKNSFLSVMQSWLYKP